MPAARPGPSAHPSLRAAPPPPAGRRLIPTLAIGFGAGMLNALVGIGGGILIVPGLAIVRKLAPRVAAATSLGSVLILSAIAPGVHLASAPFSLSARGGVLLLLAGAAGSQAGSLLLRRIATRWILIGFAGITILSAMDLLAMGLHLLPAALTRASEPALWGYAALGLMGGFFSGLLGVGGGGLVILGFSVIFHTPVLAGPPIAQAVTTFNALFGVAVQWRSRLVLWREVLALAPSGIVGVAIGQILAQVLPADALRIVAAPFFIAMGGSLIRRGRRMDRGG